MKFKTNPVDVLKAAQLKRHKALATGLFVLMVLLYASTIWLLKYYTYPWIGYVKAFAEAAMVGALADWFAVTALFHHPLGIPIPHTNLIENRKKSIGDNLGGFVVSNFLNAATIRPYITKLNISAFITQWLGNEKNVALLVAEVSKLLKDIVQKADDALVVNFITKKSKELLQHVKLNELLASGLQIIIARGDHMRILDYAVNKLQSYIIQNEDLVRARVKKESHFLIPGFVDNIIAAKITNGFAKYLSEIEKTPHHKIKDDFNNQLETFILDVKSNPKWQQELQGIKDSIVNGDKIQQYASAIWKQLQLGVIKDLDARESGIQQYFTKTIAEMVANLHADAEMQKKLNGWVQYQAYRYVLRNTQKAGDLISNTVGNWEGKELSNKLELEVGKDLQFIRINGTLVGGLMGLVIYTITKLVENF